MAGTVRWYLYEGLGSVLGEVDPTGAVTSSRKYDVYGAVRGGVNPGGTSRHKFVGSLGHPSDDETGLIYMRARYYDPAVGRFVSEDPAKDGSNWYVYCKSNPISSVDQSGRSNDPLFTFWSIFWDAIRSGSATLLFALADAFAAESAHSMSEAERLFSVACAMEISALSANSEYGAVVSGELRTLANELFQDALKQEARSIVCMNLSNQMRLMGYVLQCNPDEGLIN